jgi:MFS family permease
MYWIHPNVISYTYYGEFFSGTLIIFSVIAAYGWTSPTLPLLLGENSPLPITADQSSWVVSLMVFGMIFGPIPTSWLVDK